MQLIKKCVECGEFTLKETHCSKKTLTVHPPKYSFHDKYAYYRRKAKGLA
ncbi:MAG: nucleolar RNA-binding Nop10p family protein [Candidatus Micrarchaeota archaeon]